RFKVKWWDSLNIPETITNQGVKTWLKGKNLLPPTPIQNFSNQLFLAQRSHAMARLAGAKNDEEYFAIMEQLLQNRTNSSAANSDSEPIIDLGDDDEEERDHHITKPIGIQNIQPRYSTSDLPSSSRFSTSEIPRSALQNVDYSTNVPHPVYTNLQNESVQDETQIESEPTSPTFSAITENVNHELNVYPIPNKKDLLQKLHSAFVFSKFDMKSGFWQIQIDPKDRYKTAFTVPFGQYEWK
ncbi:hypothetical protein P3X46_035046, partial [Hevea brasiliensis]